MNDKMRPVWSSIQSIAGNVMLAIAVLCTLLVIFWWAQNTFWPSTVFRDPKVVGSDTYRIGEQIRLSYTVTRYRSCKLEIGRYVRRSMDRREVLMQSVVQIIKADNPPVGRPSGYVAEIPRGILNPDELHVDADVFSRVQYFCNALDFLWPRIVDMEPVKIVITK